MIPSRPIRLMIADDHPVVRTGLRATLDPESTVEIVGEASSFVQLTNLLQTIPADAVLLDIGGMGTPPITAITVLRRTYPKLAIIIFSGSVGGAHQVLKVGVSGYVAKEDMEDDIVTALHTVVRGETFLSPMVRDYLERAGMMRKEHELTSKEWQVLQTVAAGLGTQAAAEELGITDQTVRNYMQVLYRKTGCTERTQLADWFRHYATVDER